MGTKSAFISIVGKANVGKSTLLNALVGEKVAIVTSKPQTTRNRITGVMTKGETQYVFMDTPGYHLAKTKLSEYMVKEVKESFCDVDLVLFVMTAKGEINKTEEELLESLKRQKAKVMLIINKIDELKNKEDLLSRIEGVKDRYDFEGIVPISAKKEEGIDIVYKEIERYAQDSVHYFDSESYTDQPEREICSEIIREKILINLQEEIPHGCAVVIDSFKEKKGKKEIVVIEAIIFCEKSSHKGIIIGKQGNMLKRISTQAREDMEKFLDVKVYLECWVKIRDDWRNKESHIRHMGYN